MAPVKDYTPQQMGLAIEAVRKGMTVLKAATKYGVPRITLHNKTTGKSPIECTMGPSTVLSKEDEMILEIWIKDMAQRHIPVTKEDLLDSVQRLIIEKNLSTPFTDNRPGKKWYTSFMKRHPDISERTAQNLTTARDNVSEHQIKLWFMEVENYLKDKNLVQILEKPERIFNTDESAFFLNPKPGRVLAQKGDKHIYSSSGDEKDNLTVLVTGNAAGQLAPTMVVFNYERIPSAISSTFPEDWVIGRSDSGWMRGSTFFEYITNNFVQWLIDQKIERPVLFFLDGHKSHLTLHLSNFCASNGIEIISLYPNSTHLLQPMDLSVFRPLKNFWRKAVKSWKMQNLGQNLKKEHFAPVLKTAMDNLTSDSIKHGFRAGGLYPYGSDYVDMSKIKTQKRRTSDHNISGNGFLQSLESKIVSTFSQEKLNLFRQLYYKRRPELENCLPEEDLSLYVIWAQSLSQDTSAPHTSDQEQSASGENLSQSVATAPHTSDQEHVLAPHSSGQGHNTPRVDQDLSPSIISAPHTSDRGENAPGLDQDLSPSIISAPHTSERGENAPGLNKNISPSIASASHTSKHGENAPGEDQDVLSISPLIVSAPHTPDKAQSAPGVNLSPSIVSAPNTSKYENAPGEAPLIVLASHTFSNGENPQSVDKDLSPPTILNAPGPSHRNEIVPPPDKKEKIIIPSPFKRVLYWPGEEDVKKGKKRKLKEKLPCTVTGAAWREYHQKKEEEKKNLLEEKKKRAKERQDKRLFKENLKEQSKKKRITKKSIQTESSSSESEAEIDYAESDDSYELENDEENDEIPRSLRTSKINDDSEAENLPLSKLSGTTSKSQLLGSYVIVVYEEEYFPGIIENVSKDRYEVSTMTFSTGNTYKWPEKKDKLWYNKRSVVEHISPPILVNKRGFYAVKEMKKYSLFTS